MCFDPRQLWSVLQTVWSMFWLGRWITEYLIELLSWTKLHVLWPTATLKCSPEATNPPFGAWFGAFWGGVANFKISKNSTWMQLYEPFWSMLRRCSEFQEVKKKLEKSISRDFWNFVFFLQKNTTSFFLFFVLNLPKKGPKRGKCTETLKFFCFLLIPVLKCLKSRSFCQLFEVQFWRHAITGEGVVTIAPSVQ